MSSRIALAVVAIVSLCCLPGTANSAAEESKVLLVPSRYMLVKLGFDVSKIRDVKLMSYHDKTTASEAHLYEWNKTLKAWDPVDLPEYRSGGIADSDSTMVIVIGSDKQIPSEILDGSAWADTVTRIETLDMVTLVNSLNRIFDFSPAEWRWLAGRYGLKLKDLNQNLRRWGKYGKPGSEKSKPTTESIIEEKTIERTETKTMASDIVIEEVQPCVNDEGGEDKITEPEPEVAPEDK